MNHNKFFSLILGLTATVFSVQKSAAQVDPHFSQYYIYPMGLNPALTGAMDGDYRVSAIYRSQWGTVTSPYSTVGISADMATNRNINVGVNLYNQKAGNGGYNYTNGYFSIAYTGVKFGPDKLQCLSFGFQGGLLSRRFDPYKFQFGEQWMPGTGYNAGMPSGERFEKTTSSVFDAGFGIAYYDMDPEKNAALFGGVSAFHLTQPKDPFLKDGNKSAMPVHYSAHLGARIHLNETVLFVPNAKYSIQGNAQEKMLGAYFQLMANETTDFMLGANWRMNDALVPFAGVYFKGMTIGLSYDANVSQLGKIANSNSVNSFELSISFVGKRRNSIRTDYFKCPRF
ncbi:type IX secretion system PorP/SprF family membrane protein [Chitinophaga dinghuensis]|uniref:Type IX secretion system PorP/SprF family membrane protein n=1 Tax=Chitinophaga dinghuensis TaxID=1539050 RepID=A0A327VT45_9BACT|nr:PorP/SprF family type IX secretion system membrane protein [Chitinophaga dinghuensis]RAJ77557.1 type IX secretion system PorP/SprF family membrane protein [Chitinophaga dinghuensis]